MTSPLISSAFAASLIGGLAIGITTAAGHYTRQEPTKREQTLAHALAVARQAERLQTIFWKVLERYIAEQTTVGDHPATDKGNKDSGPEETHPDGGTPA
jgi:hypothetical protein